MDAVQTVADVAGTELPTWEYGWGVIDGPGMPESLFVESTD